MELNLAASPPTLRFSGLAGGAVREAVLPAPPAEGFHCFVSLYNRGASFTVAVEVE